MKIKRKIKLKNLSLYKKTPNGDKNLYYMEVLNNYSKCLLKYFKKI